MTSDSRHALWFLVALSASLPVALVVWSITTSLPFALCVVSSTALWAWLSRREPGFRDVAAIVWRVIGIGALATLGWLGFRFLRF